MTNGDFIRNMNNEELAEFITDLRMDRIKKFHSVVFTQEELEQKKKSMYKKFLEYLDREFSYV